MGRTNKLVDGCYSWWAGSHFTLLSAALASPPSLPSPPSHPTTVTTTNISNSTTARQPPAACRQGAEEIGVVDLLNRDALAKYILRCCQVGNRGGLIDKPGCRPDYYHTNYVLLGLACCGHRYTHSSSSAIASFTRARTSKEGGAEVEEEEGEEEWQDVDDTIDLQTRSTPQPDLSKEQLGEQAFQWTATPCEEAQSSAYVNVASGVKAAHPLFGVSIEAADELRRWSVAQSWQP